MEIVNIIKGMATTAKVFAKDVDYKTLEQIKALCNHPAFKDSPIRMMPDTHASDATVVGFSAPIDKNMVIPGIIGGDIGCGMLCVKFNTKNKDIDFEKLDKVIKSYISSKRTEVPLGVRKIPKLLKQDLNSLKGFVHPDSEMSNLGTLGGGNHFIEIDVSKDGNKYLVIHSGSRILGKKIARNHTDIAKHQNPYKIRELSYLTGIEASNYIKDASIAERYAELNRRIIADEMINCMGWLEEYSFESVHNNISGDGVIRKGAISAQKDEKLIIPLNMKDGIILGYGKGNKDWNNTAPHGAGRKMSRSDAKTSLSQQEFEESMQGIYSNSIRKKALDEAPQAYKDSSEIINGIEQTADIEEIIKPVYNFKD